MYLIYKVIEYVFLCCRDISHFIQNAHLLSIISEEEDVVHSQRDIWVHVKADMIDLWSSNCQN